MADSQRKTANLFLPPLAAKTETINDVTFSIDSNGVITINGTASANAIFKYQLKDDMSIPTSVREGGNAYLYFWNNFITSSAIVRFYNGSTLVDYWTMNSIDRILNYFENLENKTINAVEIVIYSGYTASNCELSVMLTNDGEQATEFQPYSATGWVHSLRKLTTATEAVENPLYSDGTAITAYNIKGNEEHTGTPTPSNPVEVNGVGERTENLLPNIYENHGFEWNTGTILTQIDMTRLATMEYSDIISGNITCSVSSSDTATYQVALFKYDDNYNYLSNTGWVSIPYTYDVGVNRRVRALVRKSDNSDIDTSIVKVMLNTGSTAKPYEPYGFKIPISSNGAALTPMYFSQQLFKIGDITDNYVSSGTVTYNSSKYELTGGEDWQKSASINGWFYVLNLLRIRPDSEALCTDYVYYPPSYSQSATLPNGGFAYDELKYGAYTAIAIVNTDYNNVNDFKQYLATRYAAGNPVTIYYIKQTPTTETVTAPSIPTTEGANSITVDTTVQPSEFTATWTGWHDASVKEWDGSQWS